MNDLIPGLGALPSPPDYRDIPYGAVAATPLPVTFKTDIAALPIWNQRKIGSCVGHAMAKAMQIWWYKQTGEIVHFSPRFLFALAKSQDGLPGDVGTIPRLVASIAKNVGCCTEELLPNDSTLTFAQYTDMSQITQAMYDQAARYKIPGYAFAENADEVRQAIYNHYCVALSMTIGDEWWTAPDGRISWAKQDVDPLRTPAVVVGGHEIVLYGFDGSMNDVCNSWSADWADRGTNVYDIGAWSPFIGEAIVIVDLAPQVLDIVHQLPTPTNFKHTFTTQLDPGARGQEVIYLQAALMLDGDFSKQEYIQLLSEGNLGFFKPGGDTQAALLKFQAKYAIPQYPRVGPKTLAKLNALFS